MAKTTPRKIARRSEAKSPRACLQGDERDERTSRRDAAPRAREEGFHVLAGDEGLCLRFAFAQEFAGNEIANLALADLEASLAV